MRLLRWWLNLWQRGQTGNPVPPRPPGKIIPPQGGSGVTKPKRSTPYYHRVELDGTAIEIGFATHAELITHLRNVDPNYTYIDAGIQ